MKKIPFLLLTAFMLSGCIYFINGINNRWSSYCPGFPSIEEVEAVVSEHAEFFENLERNELAHWIQIRHCPDERNSEVHDNAYIIIHHCCARQVKPILEAIDEASPKEYFRDGSRLFFGIPTLLANDF